MQVLRVALDWTPNANHVGIYVALAKGAVLPPAAGALPPSLPPVPLLVVTSHIELLQAGLFGDANLEVELISPGADDYELTPARRVARGTVGRRGL